MKMKLAFLFCALFALGVSPAPAQERLRLKRMMEAPDSLLETFFRFEDGKALIGGEVIREARLKYEKGKGGGWIYFVYENTTDKNVAPSFDVNLYNPYGIFISQIRVPNPQAIVEQVQPGKKGGEAARFAIYPPDYLLRFAIEDEYPADIDDVAWMSIKHSNTSVTPSGREKPAAVIGEDDEELFKKPELSEEVIAGHAKDHAKQLAELLAESWEVGVKGSVITVTSKFDVHLVATYNRNSPMPPMAGYVDPKVYKKHAKAEKYVFHLTYQKALEDEEFKTRYKRLRRLKDRVRMETQHDKEFTAIIRSMDELQVPAYRHKHDGFEIYKDESREMYEWVFPSDAAVKVGSARTIIAALLGSMSEQGL